MILFVISDEFTYCSETVFLKYFRLNVYWSLFWYRYAFLIFIWFYDFLVDYWLVDLFSDWLIDSGADPVLLTAAWGPSWS